MLQLVSSCINSERFKTGDAYSAFCFIIIMEGLHVAFLSGLVGRSVHGYSDPRATKGNHPFVLYK